MKIRFRNQTYTFLILPESGKAVVRIRVPRIILIILPMLFIALAGALYMLNQMNSKNVTLLNSMEAKLEMKESEMEETIIDKNLTIEKLQNDIIALSQQADEVRLKVEELKQLESDLRRLAGEPEAESLQLAESTSSDNVQPVRIASLSGNPTSFNSRNIGGLWFAPSLTDFDQLVYVTEDSFSALETEMEALYSNLLEAKDEVLAYQHLQRITPSIWPTDSRKISSEYGNRKDPFTRRTSFHSGIDIAGSSGSPVYATAEGTVTSTGYDRSKGNYILINHTGGLKTQYMHLSKITVKQGQKVEKGEVIGKMGSTGRSTGTHLHYEVIKNGRTVNPKPYMQASREG